MKISLIAAVDKNLVLGKNGQLPWHVPEDLKHFKRTTLGHHLLMGRKTFEALPFALPQRPALIVSKKSKGTNFFCEISDAVEFAKKNEEKELFVIGGGEIFSQIMTQANRLYLSRIDISVEGGDVFFPQDFYRFFTLVETKKFEKQEKIPSWELEIWERSPSHQ